MPRVRWLVLIGGLALSAVALAAALRLQPSPVVVTLAPERTYQTMRGWGASLSFTRNLNFVSQAAVDQMVEEAVNDLGLTFLRVGFGYLGEPINDNANPREIDWSRFLDKRSIEREGARGLLGFTRRVAANGEAPVLLLNKDWEESAPSWMNEAEFAENVAATILYYQNQLGVDIAFTSIDNEPMRYDSYTPDRQRALIKAMGPAFESFGLATKIALNEGIDAQSTWTYVSALQNDRTVWKYIGLLNWHLYGKNDPFRERIRDFGVARGIPTAQTEFPARLHELMGDLTLGGVSYWTRYHLADAGGPPSGRSGNYFVANLDGTSFRRNEEYWRFRQFTRYIRPGAVRMEAGSSDPAVRAFAFGRGGERVVVMLNERPGSALVTIRGLTPGRYGTSQTMGQAYRELGVQTVGASGALDVTIPAGSLLTVYRHPGVNQRPIVTDWRAAPSFLTLPAASLRLSSAAQDVEREPVTFAWSIARQPAGADVRLASSASAETTATGLTQAGEYVFTLVVQDASGGRTSRDVTVRAYAGNQPPVIAEGHRFYKDAWMVLPDSTNTYGPLFISAFDLEGDPVTTAFSVVSQPAGAKAKFDGAKVSGMTVAGTYTFRFTASDPAQTVSKDFTQVVVRR